MPTLDAGSRYDNIRRSVDSYVRANVETPLALRIYYMNQSIPQAIVQPVRWATVVFIDLGQIEEVRGAGAGSVSAWSEGTIDFNLYEKSDATGGGEVNLYTLGTLATNISQKFEIGTHIPVYDYNAVGTPHVNVLRVHERPRARPIDTPGLGIRQISLSVPLRYYAVIIKD